MEHLKEKIQDEFQAKFNKLQEDTNKVANEVTMMCVLWGAK